MKTNLHNFKWIRGFGNASYIIGASLVITSLLVNAIPPTIASAHHPDVCPNIEGNQETVPNGMELDSEGNCVPITPPPTDVCPNLEGNQETVPDGMQLDKKGDCVPIPPPPTDICPNLEGNQETVPDGMQLDKKGDCVPIPPPPTDICPNIEGNQETIPEGMQLDKKGDCVPIPPPTDVCPNIEGNQETVPDGLQLDKKGDCVPIPPPDYKLNLSHIACVEGQVEIHFVLLNVPDGITPGTLTYSYGTISPGNHTGNVWHYTDYKSDGYYNITSAAVDVGGKSVGLHNPGDYSGNYFCTPGIPGCTDPEAENFDPDATIDNGSCIYPPVPGCMDPDADNYNPNATENDGSCVYSGCTDPEATNYDRNATLDDGSCEYPPSCAWNPAISADDAGCKPKVSFGSCYNPIKGLFELKVVNKGEVGNYIGYDVYNESGIYNLGFFDAGETKSFDVPLLNGNNDTLRKYASLTGSEPWTMAGGTHVLNPNTEDICEYDPAHVEVSCNPYAEQKLTWTIYNDNNYPLDYFWTWSILSEPGGMGNIGAQSTGTFTTEFKPATMQIRMGSLQFYITPEDCSVPHSDKTPTPRSRITPTVSIKTVAPPVVTPEILIPVTGVDQTDGGSLKMLLANIGLLFLGFGLVLNGLARARKDWDI